MRPLGLPAGPLALLCIGAHCDDIEIGAGATLLRLLDEHPGSRVRWVVASGTAEREAEARASAAAFLAEAADTEVDFLGHRDGYLPWAGPSLKEAIDGLKADGEVDLVLTPHREDRHQDHRLVSELTWNTFRQHAIWEYEIVKYDGELGQPNLYVPTSAEDLDRKIELLHANYPSQRARSWWDPEAFRALPRLRGVECAARSGLAEAFHARKVVVGPGATTTTPQDEEPR